MPGAEVKEPRKWRKVEDGEVGVSSKAKKTSSGPAQDAPLQELIEELRDQMEWSNWIAEEWLVVFQVEMAESWHKMEQMRWSLGHKLWDLHTQWDGMDLEDSEPETEMEAEEIEAELQ
jgi:hypothetical protein